MPRELLPYIKGKQFLSTKQVPCALALKGFKSASLTARATDAAAIGFPMRQLINGVYTKVEAESAVENIFQNADREGSSLEDYCGQLDYLPKPFIPSGPVKLDYQDPFKILAAQVFLDLIHEVKPTVFCWPAKVTRLTDKIPAEMLGPNWEGQRGAKFSVLPAECQIYLILHHTHWGFRLHELQRLKETKTFAKLLWSRIKAFLAGKPDPTWGKDFDPYAPETNRSRRQRSGRFLEMLQTVEGMFTQRFTSLPEEKWDWDKYDLYTLRNISHLLCDEFFDGELRIDFEFPTDTKFSQLKKIRKTCKQKIHSTKGAVNFQPHEKITSWAHELYTITEIVSGFGLIHKTFATNVVEQTRMCGKVPPLVGLKTKFDTLSLYSAPDHVTDSQLRLVAASMEHLLKEFPDEAFTGLTTKAHLTITTAACWEDTKREGGTITAINELISGCQTGKKVPIVDLYTGAITGEDTIENLGIGTYVFWASLDYVLHCDPEETSSVFIVMADEPAKSRTVSKGHAALKMVLDVVNKLCSWPLKKGLASSTSGMEKANHAWNMFREFFKKEHEDICFSELSSSTKTVNGKDVVETFYRHFYTLSTDYSAATDYFSLKRAKVIGTLWMRKVGIPPMLIGIVARFCYEPRWVYFSASGPLIRLGEATHMKDVRRTRLVRGLLMGDPLTKVTLHLLNAAVRKFAQVYGTVDFSSPWIQNYDQVFEWHLQKKI